MTCAIENCGAKAIRFVLDPRETERGSWRCPKHEAPKAGERISDGAPLSVRKFLGERGRLW